VPANKRVAPVTETSFRCRLCDSTGLRFCYALGNDGQYRYYRCPVCALVNLDLREAIEILHDHRGRRDPLDDDDSGARAIDATFEFLRRRVPAARSLCDIGCGSGRLLHLAQRSGWRVFGLELHEPLARLTAETLDIEVAAADFLGFDPPPAHLGAYEVVCLRHVLEHLPDSRLAMRRIGAMLKPGGHALLEFPNIDGLEKRFKRWLVDRGWHRRRFREGFAAGHCNEFCRESFEYLLQSTGFRLVHWETYSKKPLTNQIYRRLPIGNQVRALVQKPEC
jgi:SAM-dependent methyltransferase